MTTEKEIARDAIQASAEVCCRVGFTQAQLLALIAYIACIVKAPRLFTMEEVATEVKEALRRGVYPRRDNEGMEPKEDEDDD